MQKLRSDQPLQRSTTVSRPTLTDVSAPEECGAIRGLGLTPQRGISSAEIGARLGKGYARANCYRYCPISLPMRPPGQTSFRVAEAIHPELDKMAFPVAMSKCCREVPRHHVRGTSVSNSAKRLRRRYSAPDRAKMTVRAIQGRGPSVDRVRQELGRRNRARMQCGSSVYTLRRHVGPHRPGYSIGRSWQEAPAEHPALLVHLPGGRMAHGPDALE